MLYNSADEVLEYLSASNIVTCILCTSLIIYLHKCMMDKQDQNSGTYYYTYYIRGAFIKFCNSTIKNNGIGANNTLFFNILTAEFNAFATFL